MSEFEDWARELGEFLDTTARRAEAWAEQTLVTFVATADHVVDELEKQLRPSLERLAEELHQSLEPLETGLEAEAEQFASDLSEWLTPMVDPLADVMESWLEAIAAPLASHIDPVVNEHPTCIGCKHYYGQAFGGNMLVCAMYPYGPDQEHCPDWESVWGQPPDSNG